MVEDKDNLEELKGWNTFSGKLSNISDPAPSKEFVSSVMSEVQELNKSAKVIPFRFNRVIPGAAAIAATILLVMFLIPKHETHAITTDMLLLADEASETLYWGFDEEEPSIEELLDL